MHEYLQYHPIEDSIYLHDTSCTYISTWVCDFPMHLLTYTCFSFPQFESILYTVPKGRIVQINIFKLVKSL